MANRRHEGYRGRGEYDGYERGRNRQDYGSGRQVGADGMNLSSAASNGRIEFRFGGSRSSGDDRCITRALK
jgi:hypothetical protein